MQERWPVDQALSGSEPPAGSPDGAPAGWRRRHSVLITLGVAASVVLVDQVTKSLAEHSLASGPVHVVGPLELNLQYNTGSAFSLFTGDSAVLAGIAALLVVGLVAVATRVRSRWIAVSLGLVLGGALGNLSDRLLRGHHGAVVDFVALRFWPTFNLADSAIVVGILALVVALLRQPSAPRPVTAPGGGAGEDDEAGEEGAEP